MSLLFPMLVAPAISACAARSPGPAAPSEGVYDPSNTAASAEPSTADPSTSGNPAEAPPHSSSVGLADDSPEAAAKKAEKIAFITGVTLTSTGAFAALMGGVFLGRSGGFCHSYEDTCGAAVGFPLTGTLWVGASVLPLVLGVTILLPNLGASPSPSSLTSAASSARPTVFMGPASAGVRIPF